MKLFKLNEDAGHGNIDRDSLYEFLEKYKNHEISLGLTLNNLVGGVGDKITISGALEKFDFNQIYKGINVELEHTNNLLIAFEIAVDHLMENDKYYTYLENMESQFNEESFGVNSGFAGANTGGTRSSISKKWPDLKDLEEEVPDDLKKSNIVQPILKEPNDSLKPKGSPKGPGD